MAIFISIPYKEHLLSLNYSDNELLMLETELSDIQHVEFLIKHHHELNTYFNPLQITTILTKNLSLPLLSLSIGMIKELDFPVDEFHRFLVTDVELSLKLTLLAYLKKHIATLALNPGQLLTIAQTESPMHRFKFLLEHGQSLVANYFLPSDLFDLMSTGNGYQNLKKHLPHIKKFIGYSSSELKFVFFNAHKLESIIKFQEFFGKQLTAKEMIELLNFRKFTKKDLEVFFSHFDALIHLGFSKTKIIEIYYAAQEPLILNALVELTPDFLNDDFTLTEIAQLACYCNGSTYLRTIRGLRSLWSLSEYQLLKPSDIAEIIFSNREHGDFLKFLQSLAYLKQFLSIARIIQLAKIDSGVAYLKLLADKLRLLSTKGVDKVNLMQVCQTSKQDQILDFLIANYQTIQTLRMPTKNLLDFLQGSLKQGNKDEGKMQKRIMPFFIKMERFSNDCMVDILALLIRHRDQLTLEKCLNYAQQLKSLGFTFDDINQIIQVEHSKPNISLLITNFHLLEQIGLNYQSVSALISQHEGFTKLVSLLKSMEMIAKLIKPNLLKPIFAHFQLADYPQIAASFYLNLKKEVDLKLMKGDIELYESLKLIHLSKEEILEHLQLALMQVKFSNKHLSKRNKLPDRLRGLLGLGITVEQIQWMETLNNSAIIMQNILDYGHFLHDVKLNALQILEFFFKKSNGPLTDFPFEKIKGLTKPPLNLKPDKLYQLLITDEALQNIGMIEKFFTRFKSLGYDLDTFLKLILSVKHIDKIIETLYGFLPTFLQHYLSLEDIRVIAFWNTSEKMLHELKNLLEQLSLAGIEKQQLIQELQHAKGQLNYQLLNQQFSLFKGIKLPFSEIVKLVGQGMDNQQLQHQLYFFCLGQSLGLTLEQVLNISELPNGIQILDNLSNLSLDFKNLGFNEEQIVSIFMKHLDRAFLKSLLDNLNCLFVEPYALNQMQVYRILMADNFGYCISVTTRCFPQWRSLGLVADQYLNFIINKPQLIPIADELYSLVPHFIRTSFGFDDIFACGQFIHQSGEFGKLFYVQSLLGVLGFSKQEFVESFIAAKGQLNLDELSSKLPLFNGLVLSFSQALEWIGYYCQEESLIKNIENLKLHQFGLTKTQQKNIKSLANSALIIKNLLTLGLQFKVHHFSMEQIVFIFKKFTDLNALISITKDFSLLQAPYQFKPQQLFDLLLANNYQECLALSKQYYPDLQAYGLKSEQFLFLIINKSDSKLLIEELLNLTPRFLENQMGMPEIWDVACLIKTVGDLSKFLILYKALLKMGVARNELLDEFKTSHGQLPLEVIHKKLCLFKTADLTFKQMLVLIDEYPTNNAIKHELGKRDLSTLSLFKSSEDKLSRKRSNCESRLG